MDSCIKPQFRSLRFSLWKAERDQNHNKFFLLRVQTQQILALLQSLKLFCHTPVLGARRRDLALPRYK